MIINDNDVYICFVHLPQSTQMCILSLFDQNLSFVRRRCLNNDAKPVTNMTRRSPRRNTGMDMNKEILPTISEHRENDFQNGIQNHRFVFVFIVFKQ